MFVERAFVHADDVGSEWPFTVPAVADHNRDRCQEFESVASKVGNGRHSEGPVRPDVLGVDIGAFDEHDSGGDQAVDVTGLMAGVGAAGVVHPLGGPVRRVTEAMVDFLRAQAARAGVMASETAGYVHHPTVGAIEGGDDRSPAFRVVVVPSVRLELTLDGF